MAYGSPSNLDDVASYITDIRGGVRPNDHFIKEFQDRYRAIDGKESINDITKKQADCLQAKLDKKYFGIFKVFIGMKHWHPYIGDAVAQIQKEKYQRVITLVLTPQYSKMSIGGYKDILTKALSQAAYSPNLTFIDSWHLHQKFIGCLALQIKKCRKRLLFSKKSTVIFTAHSLPERIKKWNDPYEKQIKETCEAVAKACGLTNWKLAFQSAGRTPEPWLGPDIHRVFEDICKRGITDILICPVGFVSDNLELLYDIDIEAKKEASALGLQLHRVAACNYDPLFIDSLYEIVSSSASE